MYPMLSMMAVDRIIQLVRKKNIITFPSKQQTAAGLRHCEFLSNMTNIHGYSASTHTWQDECKTIASPIGCMSQQWQALECVPCFALSSAYNRLPHVLRQTG